MKILQRCIVLLIALTGANCFADLNANIQLDGTLYKKNGNWFLFVESSKASFKKGSIQLVLSSAKKKQLKNYLIEQLHITVSGDKTDCDSTALRPPTCIAVDSIAPTLYHPLEKSLGK